MNDIWKQKLCLLCGGSGNILGEVQPMTFVTCTACKGKGTCTAEINAKVRVHDKIMDAQWADWDGWKEFDD